MGKGRGKRGMKGQCRESLGGEWGTRQEVWRTATGVGCWEAGSGGAGGSGGGEGQGPGRGRGRVLGPLRKAEPGRGSCREASLWAEPGGGARRGAGPGAPWARPLDEFPSPSPRQTRASSALPGVLTGRSRQVSASSGSQRLRVPASPGLRESRVPDGSGEPERGFLWEDEEARREDRAFGGHERGKDVAASEVYGAALLGHGQHCGWRLLPEAVALLQHLHLGHRR